MPLEPAESGAGGSPSSAEVEHGLHELTRVLHVLPDAVVVVDDRARVREWNQAAADMFGWSRELLVGSPVELLVPASAREHFRRVWHRLRVGSPVQPYETWRRNADGTEQLVSVHAGALHEDGAFLGAVATFRELSQRVAAERLLSDLLGSVPVLLAAYDEDSRVTFAAGGGYRRTGVEPVFAEGTRLLASLHAGSPLHRAVEQSLQGRTAQVQLLLDDRVWQCHVGARAGGGFVSAVDVSREQVLNDRLHSLLAATPLAFVTFDAGGRATFAAGTAFSDAGVDPDDLVGLNLLRAYGGSPDIAQALVRCLAGHSVDLVAEHAGRLWELSYRSYRDASGAITGGVCIAQDTTARPLPGADPAEGEQDPATGLPLPTGAVHLGARVGTSDTAQTLPAALLQAAEEALDRSAGETGPQPSWLPDVGRSVARDNVRAVARLREALEGDELRLHYQPIVQVGSGEVVAVEALVRWQHPEEGLLGPATFVPLAERTGLIHRLGRWTTRQACKQALALRQEGTPLQVSVNVAAPQLVRPDFVDDLVASLAETGCPASSLTLEITESALTSDLDRAVATLVQLKELGVSVALDDFGTGYSSLMYLRRFPVDVLKIDRSFVAGIAVDPDDAAIVTSTITLAHSVGVRCVAEGVETLPQLAMLEELGCDFVQGYLFSRALPAPQLTAWLSDVRLVPPGR